MEISRDLVSPTSPGTSRPLPSRINSVLEINGKLVVKISGPKFRRGLRVYDPRAMLRHEAECLKVLEGYDIAPRLIFERTGVLGMTWCGQSIDSAVLPRNWESQIREIASALTQCGISHFDLKKENLVFDGDRIRVIDFGWSFLGGKGFRPGRFPSQRFPLRFEEPSVEDTEAQLVKIVRKSALL